MNEWQVVMWKILVISLSDNEEKVFNQTVKWLSDKLNCSAVVLEQQQQRFSLDLYTRSWILATVHILRKVR